MSFSLQKSVKATGADVPQAVLDYIRNNDVLILEGCDKVGVFGFISRLLEMHIKANHVTVEPLYNGHPWDPKFCPL